jgi:hypothetical protein
MIHLRKIGIVRNMYDFHIIMIYNFLQHLLRKIGKC